VDGAGARAATRQVGPDARPAVTDVGNAQWTALAGAGIGWDDRSGRFGDRRSTFGPFFTFNVYPVLEIQQTASIGMEAVQFRSSVG